MGNEVNSKLKMLDWGEPCEIDLEGLKLKLKDMKKIGQEFAPNKTGYALKMKECKLGEDAIPGLQAICDGLAVNTALKRWYLPGTSIGDAGCEVLGTFMTKNRFLGLLDLNDCGIGVKGITFICSGLSVNNHIHSLYLAENKIGPDGAEILAEAIKTHQKLKVLDVSSCGLGDKGAKSIALCLKANSNILEQLFLVNNEITATGARAFTDCLLVNRTIRTLNLDYNPIGDNGARPFVSVLKDNHIIQDICVDDKSVSDDWKKEFKTRLQRHKEESTKSSQTETNVIL